MEPLTLLIYAVFIAAFVLAIVAIFYQMKGTRELRPGDILRKILKERYKTLKLNAIPDVKYVVYTGGKGILLRRPGNKIGKYIGSLEWEYVTEIAVRRFLRKLYLVIPNEYVSDPNRKYYVLRCRGVSFHTFAYVPVVDTPEEQERVFDKVDDFLKLLIDTAMRYENKETVFRKSLEIMQARKESLPRYIIERKEEIQDVEEEE